MADNFYLGLVCRGNLDEDVLRVKCDLAVVAVDDRRKGKYGSVGVVDNRIDG